jgi:hypothetical protein
LGSFRPLLLCLLLLPLAIPRATPLKDLRWLATAAAAWLMLTAVPGRLLLLLLLLPTARW